jgi:hypothetical protein
MDVSKRSGFFLVDIYIYIYMGHRFYIPYYIYYIYIYTPTYMKKIPPYVAHVEHHLRFGHPSPVKIPGAKTLSTRSSRACTTVSAQRVDPARVNRRFNINTLRRCADGVPGALGPPPPPRPRRLNFQSATALRRVAPRERNDYAVEESYGGITSRIFMSLL